MKQNQINIKNKRAHFDYEIGDTYTAGIVLTGTEIKSIRDSKASLADSYCIVENGEIWVKGMHIAEYFFGSYNNHSTLATENCFSAKKRLPRYQKPPMTRASQLSRYACSFPIEATQNS